MSYYLVTLRGEVIEVCTDPVEAYRVRNKYRKDRSDCAARVQKVEFYDNPKFL